MKNTNEVRRQFYLSFFDKEEGYEEQAIHGDLWLIKQWDGQLARWTVHLYSEESYQNYKRAQNNYSNNNKLL